MHTYCTGQEEYARRIFCRNPLIYQQPASPPPNNAQRKLYCEWLSGYYDEPYEWGGEWVGGKETPGTQTAGGCGPSEGYGIDCSGLVSNGAFRAGYNWGWWRALTSDLASDYYSTATDNPLPGDILVKPGAHVVTITARDADVITIIHAKGGPGNHPWPDIVRNRVWVDVNLWLPDFLDDGYQARSLRQH